MRYSFRIQKEKIGYKVIRTPDNFSLGILPTEVEATRYGKMRLGQLPSTQVPKVNFVWEPDPKTHELKAMLRAGKRLNAQIASVHVKGPTTEHYEIKIVISGPDANAAFKRLEAGTDGFLRHPISARSGDITVFLVKPAYG